MKKAVYPGSFDPITFGHADIIKRAAALFDEVVVCIMINLNKKTLFSLVERKHFIEKLFEDVPNVSVDVHEGLLIDYAKTNQCDVIVKGLRNGTDFDYETNMEFFNHKMAPDVETVYLKSADNLMHVSSSAVKELARYGCDIAEYVPDFVVSAVEKMIVD